MRALVLAVLLVGLASTRVAGDGAAFKVIVNPENPVDAVDRNFLRDAYLRKAPEWGDGATIRPIDLAPRFAVRDSFTQRVIRKTPSQLTTYWNQQVFSGKGVPPPEAGSIGDTITYVLANRGAVGYIPADIDPGRAKVVPIR